MATAGIKHIEFWVSDLKRSLDFYGQLFPLIGWQKFDESSFTGGGAKIYFVEKNVTFVQNVGPRHICFFAESRIAVDQVGDFLKKAGAPIIRGPLESSYHGRTSYTVDFRDPDGYILEVALTVAPS